MSSVLPIGQKFHTVASTVDTENKGSAQLNAKREAYTLDDISSSFTKIELHFPTDFDPVVGLPPLNGDLTRVFIAESFDSDIISDIRSFNWINTSEWKGSNPIGGYAYQIYNEMNVRTDETTSTVLSTQQNRLNYRGKTKPWFAFGDTSVIYGRANADTGEVAAPHLAYGSQSQIFIQTGTGVVEAFPSDTFYIGHNVNIKVESTNFSVNWMYGVNIDVELGENSEVADALTMCFLNADLLGGFSGSIQSYNGIYHDADGFTVGGNTTEAYFIKNVADMPIDTAGGLTFSGGLPAHADDAAAAAAGLTAGQVYQTDGTGAAPLNAAGILMIKQ